MGFFLEILEPLDKRLFGFGRRHNDLLNSYIWSPAEIYTFQNTVSNGHKLNPDSTQRRLRQALDNMFQKMMAVNSHKTYYCVCMCLCKEYNRSMSAKSFWL